MYHGEKEILFEEKLNEMIVWLNNHANELPKEMQINKFSHPNLKLLLKVASWRLNNVWVTIRWLELFRLLQQIGEEL